jgi:hypothetical protein
MFATNGEAMYDTNTIGTTPDNTTGVGQLALLEFERHDACVMDHV